MNQQAKKEVRIFKMFAKLTPYSIPIRLSSITKKEPPEPDISCNLSDGTAIAFELVECIDNSMAGPIYDSLRLKKVFENMLERLPNGKKERFKVKFKNASICVAFVKGISVNKKKSAISTIFDYLLTLENTAEGKFNLRSSRHLKDAVRWVSITRGGFVGPLFDVEAVTSFVDSVKVRIRDKFRKEYKTKSKTELLVYYELQPEIPGDDWLPSVEKFVENNIKTSVFQRVWIYSIPQNKIICVYPAV